MELTEQDIDAELKDRKRPMRKALDGVSDYVIQPLAVTGAALIEALSKIKATNDIRNLPSIYHKY